MPKKPVKPLEATTINLFLGDRETLQKFYGKSVGYGVVIRELVHNHCLKLIEAESRKGSKVDVRELADSVDLGELAASSSGADE